MDQPMCNKTVRHYKSLPSLCFDQQSQNFVQFPHELWTQPQGKPSCIRSNRTRRRGDDSLAFIVSVFYAKIMVILGIALPITNAIATSGFDSYDFFYLYLYGGSIAFLFYMYIIQMREKSLAKSWSRRSYSPASNDSSTTSIRDEFAVGHRDYSCTMEKCHHHHQLPLHPSQQRCQHNNDNTHRHGHKVRYGSFYFRMGVTGFGIGSVIYSGLQFGQYFELSSQKDCDNVLKAVKPLLRILFGLMQMLFIFSYSNFNEEQRVRICARFGLMHMIATNLCEWFSVLIAETQYDIYKSSKRRQDVAARDNLTLSQVDFEFLNSNSYLITRQLYEHKFDCLRTNIMEPILVRTEPYLAPCTVEYSLLCAVILGLMWNNARCSHDVAEHQRSEGAAQSRERQSGCNVIHTRRQSQFSVDCSRAHKGLFTGILVLAVTVLSLIMFFELVCNKQFKDIAILQVNVWEAVLFWMGTVACVLCIWALRDVEFRRKKRGLEIEHLLLLVTQSGVFMYFLFQIIGAALMGHKKGKGGIMRIITPFSALVQSACQTILVKDAWRRRCTSSLQMRRKPGRQLITFLLVINIALWMVNRLKNNRSVSHPNQMDFYGVLAWNIITHVTMPLVVSYRFQSTVCFYEVWKHVYKVRNNRRCDGGLCRDGGE